jgi:proteasome assembly chaperone (PAC2) family protein
MSEAISPLVIDGLPSGLRRPVLAVAFSGWNDAAEVATTAARFLIRSLDVRRVAVIHPEEFYHFGLTRPEVRFQPGSKLVREVHWPTTDFYLATDPAMSRDLLIGMGIEPHLKWQTYCAHILTLARRAEVDQVITLGALLADVPHTRPIRVNGVATDPELVRRFHTTLTKYEGPTGIVGILNDACRRAGIPTVSLWANVPHYVSEVSNPHAVLALLRRVASFLDWEADLGDLEESALEFDRQLERIVAQKPEVARYIQELEQRDAKSAEDAEEPGGDLPPAADLIREVEQFLRQQRNRPDQGETGSGR